jgi:hypothetical protein
MAEGGGFEPPEACTSTVFKTVKYPSPTPKIPSHLGVLGVSGRQTLPNSDPMMGKMMGKPNGER